MSWLSNRRRSLGVAVLALLSAATVALRRGSRLRELEGRWRRADGGYVLDIRKVRPDGAMDAAYLNPRPINVSKAQATRDGATVRVFVELRAPNYPGAPTR